MSTRTVLQAPVATQAQSARTVLLVPRLGLFAAVVVACCVASRAGLMQGKSLLPVVLAAIAIAMWHGAYDQVQAEQVLASRFGSRWLAVFLTCYVSLAALTLLGWWLFPLASLVLFLAYSAWHFGTEPERLTPRFSTALAAFAFGAAPIVAACRWHVAEVKPIFAQMLFGASASESNAGVLVHGLALACWPVLAFALACVALGQFGRGLAQRVELFAVATLIIVLFRFCNPMLAFAVYFCCWHTPEHLVSTSVPERSDAALGANLARNLRAGFVPWVFSLLFLGAVFFFGQHAAASYKSEIFIVLSALTVPHMALNEFRHMQSSRQANVFELSR